MGPLVYLNWITPWVKTVMHMRYIISAFTAFTSFIHKKLFLWTDVPFLQVKSDSYWSLYWIWHIKKAIFTGFLWAKPAPLNSHFRRWPYCQHCSILIYTCVFHCLSPTSIHFPIIPSVLPFPAIFPFLYFPPLPFITVLCWCVHGGRVSSSILLGET